MIDSPAAQVGGLTEDQRQIAEAAPEARMLVTAGPGTGKTWILVNRLIYLVEECGLAPGSDLLVLSFSRSAVQEIRRRVQDTSRDARYVSASTFDSFATRLLMESNPDGSWSSESYDSRVRCITERIRTNVEVRMLISDYRHLLVDEVQDLVGERADFVQAILEAGSGGFTLLGDPAQGIYNFQLKNAHERRQGSQMLYDWVRRRFGQHLIERTLTKNHRATTTAAQVALAAGSRLNSPQPDYPRIKESLDSTLLSLPSLGTVEEAAPFLAQAGKKTVLLCRDNGTALLLSRKLYEYNVPHILQRRASDRVPAKWLGVVFAEFPRTGLGRSTFAERFTMCFPDAEASLPALWADLTRWLKVRGNNIDLEVAARRLRSGDVPDYLVQDQRADVTASTIHRAKGLEFDHVVIVEGDARDDDDAVLEEETRLLYVALTRARRRLWHMKAPATRGLSKLGRDARWVRRFGWKVAGVEVRGSDTDTEDPPGGMMLGACDVVDLQGYLRSEVRPGDPVTLSRLTPSANGADRVWYGIIHRGRPIGLLSQQFNETLYSLLKLSAGWEVRWPYEITDLHLEAVATVAGNAAAGERGGLGPTGIWLSPRVAGLGHPLFESLKPS